MGCLACWTLLASGFSPLGLAVSNELDSSQAVLEMDGVAVETWLSVGWDKRLGPASGDQLGPRTLLYSYRPMSTRFWPATPWTWPYFIFTLGVPTWYPDPH